MTDEEKTKTQLLDEVIALRQQVADLHTVIAAHAQAEAAQQERAEHFQTLFEHANDAIMALTLDGIFTAVNQGTEVLLGWSREEQLGHHYREFLTPASLAFVEERARQIQDGEKVSSIYEVELLHKDGRVVSVEARSRFIRNREGQPIGILAIHRDISVRKREEEELVRLSSAVSTSTDSIVLTDLEGRIIEVNAATLELHGVGDKGDLIGKSAFDFIAPEDQERAFAGMKEVLERGYVKGREYSVIRNNGSKIPVEMSVSIIKNVAGSPIGFAGISRDITGRKQMEKSLRQAEEQYRSIFENAVEGIFQSTSAGAILSANPALAGMLGYASPEELKAQVTNVNTQLYTDPHRRAEVLALLHEQGTVHGVEAQLTRKDGSTFWVAFSIRAVPDATGALLYYEGSVEDITQRRAADQLKEEFVSIVSHELRTPLTSIRGSLGLLASGRLGPLSEKGQHMVDIAVRNTDRLVRLINDILDVERMQSGKVSMSKTRCNLADLMTHATEVMQAMAEKAGVALVVQPVQGELWGDPDRLLQTLTNLLSNAIKFSSTGTTVWLTAEQREEQLLVQVKDQGRGIPAEKLESIFERFQQVDVSDSREKEGTGLGLAICRNIVQQHGGRIWAESTFGVGSTFFFVLPTVKEKESDAPLLTVGSPVVLVCDDDPEILDMLGTVLEQHDYAVVKAISGQEAVAQAAARQPAAILLDLIMPGMSGCEAMAILKENPATRDIPIIIFSGIQPDKPLPAGVADWLHKPLDEQALFLALEREVGRRATRRARVLVVEDDRDLAHVLTMMFQRNGIDTAHALTGREAICLCEHLTPDLLVLDLILPDGDGFTVVNWLRQRDRLRQIPLVVYSVKDLDAAEREQLRLGQTQFFAKGRISPEEFEQRVIGLLRQITPAPAGAPREHETLPAVSH